MPKRLTHYHFVKFGEHHYNSYDVFEIGFRTVNTTLENNSKPSTSHQDPWSTTPRRQRSHRPANIAVDVNSTSLMLPSFFGVDEVIYKFCESWRTSRS